MRRERLFGFETCGAQAVAAGLAATYVVHFSRPSLAAASSSSAASAVGVSASVSAGASLQPSAQNEAGQAAAEAAQLALHHSVSLSEPEVERHLSRSDGVWTTSERPAV